MNLRNSVLSTNTCSRRWKIIKEISYLPSLWHFQTQKGIVRWTQMRAPYKLDACHYKSRTNQQKDKLATGLGHWQKQSRPTTPLRRSVLDSMVSIATASVPRRYSTHHSDEPRLSPLNIELRRCDKKTCMVAALSIWIRLWRRTSSRHQKSSCRCFVTTTHRWGRQHTTKWLIPSIRNRAAQVNRWPWVQRVRPWTGFKHTIQTCQRHWQHRLSNTVLSGVYQCWSSR